MKKIFVLFTFYICISFLLFENIVFADAKTFDKKMINTIKYGQKNPDVLFLQKTLYDFGYYRTDDENTSKFPGRFDKETKDALLSFQKENEISVTGEVDKKTIELLNSFLDFQGSIEEGDDVTDNASTSLDIVDTIDTRKYFEDENSDVSKYTDNLDGYKEDVQKKYSDELKGKEYNFGNAFSYYLNMPGLSLVTNTIKRIFSAKNSEVLEVRMPDQKYSNFNIFDCIRNPDCSKNKIK